MRIEDNPPTETPISDPPARHRRRRKWTMEHKAWVADMVRRGYSHLEIYRETGASKRRQYKIMKELRQEDVWEARKREKKDNK